MKNLNDFLSLARKTEFLEVPYMEKAIKSLPNNFGLEFNPSAYFNTTISFINNDDSSRLIDYKGGLVFRLDDKKKLFVGKIPEHEYVVEDLQQYIYQVNPASFATIIKITSHPVVKKHKKYSYPKYEYISYKGVSAVKIYFEIRKKHGGQSGYVIINMEDMAIMSLSYSINPIKNWIVAVSKKKIEKVSLDGYYVESDYSKNDEGKYIFDYGRENIVLRNSAGKKKASTTSEVYLKRVYRDVNAEKMVELKNIF